MARPRPVPPPDAPPAEESRGQAIAKMLAAARAEKIREAWARDPRPTHEAIAVEVGCCLKTVWNVIHGRTHAG